MSDNTPEKPGLPDHHMRSRPQRSGLLSGAHNPVSRSLVWAKEESKSGSRGGTQGRISTWANCVVDFLMLSSENGGSFLIEVWWEQLESS